MSEPRWLTAEERSSWLALTGLLTKLPGALDAQLARDSGLSFFEYMVLAMLAEQPEETLRMTALADLTNGSLSRLSHVVQRLEGQGLVRRETCAQDRRATNAILTPAGREKVEAAAPGHVARVRTLVIDAVSPQELAAFGQVGEQILGRVHEHRGS